MNKLGHFLLILVIAVISAYGGYYYATSSGSQLESEDSNTIAQDYKGFGLDLSLCAESTGRALQNCLDNLLMQKAILDSKEGLCDEIKNVDINARCKSQLRAAEIVQNSSVTDFCKDFSDAPICEDLAHILFASILLDPSRCAEIGNRGLTDFCTRELEVATLTSVPGPVNNTFGILCLEGDQNCLLGQADFNQAVLTGNDSICSTSLYLSSNNQLLCEREVLLYQQSQYASQEECAGLANEVECRFTVIASQARRSANVGICNQLLDQNQVQSCRESIQLDIDRFGYLQ